MPLASRRRPRHRCRIGALAGRLALGAVLLAAPQPGRAACPSGDVEHSAWTALLQRWVRDGQVDYAGWSRAGRPQLDAYLEQLSATCTEDYQAWSVAQRLAFWLNAYNAFTVKLILDHYPLASIREIGWLPGAAFRERFIPMPHLKGGAVSLNAIEHDTIRADFREPRIHFALVCASRSCPPLRPEAYRGADLDRQLEDQTRRFLRDTSKNRFAPESRTLHLSAIFDWFAADFGAGPDALRDFAARYLDDPRLRQAEIRVEFLAYDWRLNDQAPPR